MNEHSTRTTFLRRGSAHDAPTLPAIGNEVTTAKLVNVGQQGSSYHTAARRVKLKELHDPTPTRTSCLDVSMRPLS